MKSTAPLPPPMSERHHREFDDWVYCRRGLEGIRELIEVYDTCLIGSEMAIGQCRINVEQRATVREKAIHLIVAEGWSEVVVGGMKWRTDGKRLYAAMA